MFKLNPLRHTCNSIIISLSLSMSGARGVSMMDICNWDNIFSPSAFLNPCHGYS